MHMTDKLTQKEINDTAWAACDTFRGVIDAAQYKDYILVMLFLKYVSDLWKDHYEEFLRPVWRRRGAHSSKAGA